MLEKLRRLQRTQRNAWEAKKDQELKCKAFCKCYLMSFETKTVWKNVPSDKITQSSRVFCKRIRSTCYPNTTIGYTYRLYTLHSLSLMKYKPYIWHYRSTVLHVAYQSFSCLGCQQKRLQYASIICEASHTCKVGLVPIRINKYSCSSE